MSENTPKTAPESALPVPVSESQRQREMLHAMQVKAFRFFDARRMEQAEAEAARRERATTEVLSRPTPVLPRWPAD